MNLFNKAPKCCNDEQKVRSINFWHFILISFIILWVAGAYIYLEKKTDVSLTRPPVILLDSGNALDMTNFFSVSATNTTLFQKQLGGTNTPQLNDMFQVREKYFFGDVIVVKYFYVEALILGKTSSTSDEYDILYKDHNHVLQKISLPREMLMAPASGLLNPMSLLVD